MAIGRGPTRIVAGFGNPTDQYSSLDYAGGLKVGDIIERDGKRYMLQQADDTVAVNKAVALDLSGDADGEKITPTSAETDRVVGVAETAFTDEYYGFITIQGIASALVADGTAIGDKLVASSASGVLAPLTARGRVLLTHSFSDGGTLSDSTTYKRFLIPGFACTVKAVTFLAQTAPAGAGTIKVLKATSSGNTMLSAASFDATTLTDNTGAPMTLTSTAADLVLTATQGVYVEIATGSASTDCVNLTVSIEVQPSVVDQPSCAIALEANSSGSAAAKDVILLPNFV